jgi:hypothetical protein
MKQKPSSRSRRTKSYVRPTWNTARPRRPLHQKFRWRVPITVRSPTNREQSRLPQRMMDGR